MLTYSITDTDGGVNVTPTPRKLARQETEQGKTPIPIDDGEKAPKGKNWPKRRRTDPGILNDFNDDHRPQNMGILLGEPSNNTVDVDCDSKEATTLAQEILPQTDDVTGRDGSPESHHWYVADDQLPPTSKYVDPLVEKTAEREHVTLVELRASGQTVRHGRHPSGEWIKQYRTGVAAHVNGAELAKAVAKLAAAALLVRYWNTFSRHDVALRLAGALLRAGWSREEVVAFIGRIATAAGDDDVADRERAAEDTADKYDNKEEVAGLPSLAELIDERLVKALAEWLDLGKHASHAPDGRLYIVATAELLTMTRQAWDAVLNKNAEAPGIFQQGNVLVQVVRDKHSRLYSRAVTVPIMRRIVAEACCFCTARTVPDGKGKSRTIIIEAYPPDKVVEDMLAHAHPDIPELRRIIDVPTITADGELLMTPGYHAASGIYYEPSPTLVLPSVPSAPTHADIDAARRFLCDELLPDFPFADKADKAHALAALLLSFVRELIDGPTPLHLIEGTTPGSGKGLLVDAITAASLGTSVGRITEARDDDEWRKRITACLRDGYSAIVLDNISRPLDSAALAAALTATEWNDRLLGKSETVRLAVSCLWLATGNNPTTSLEIARRTVRIRLDPKVERPWLRTTFRHPRLHEWAMEHRGDLVGASLTLICAWQAAGCPPGPTTLGSYERWAAVVGGILHVAGIPGFLGNLSNFYEAADTENAAWQQLVELWHEKYKAQAVGVTELFGLAQAVIGLDLGTGTERSQQTRFGLKLNQQRDRIISGFQLALGSEKRHAKQWKLIKVRQDGTAPNRDEEPTTVVEKCEPCEPWEPSDSYVPSQEPISPLSPSARGDTVGREGSQGSQGSHTSPASAADDRFFDGDSAACPSSKSAGAPSDTVPRDPEVRKRWLIAAEHELDAGTPTFDLSPAAWRVAMWRQDADWPARRAAMLAGADADGELMRTAS